MLVWYMTFSHLFTFFLFSYPRNVWKDLCELRSEELRFAAGVLHADRVQIAEGLDSRITEKRMLVFHKERNSC